jgi:hypothetical protein
MDFLKLDSAGNFQPLLHEGSGMAKNILIGLKSTQGIQKANESSSV